MRTNPANGKRFFTYFRLFAIMALVLCIVITTLQFAYTEYAQSKDAKTVGNSTFELLMYSQTMLFEQLDRVLSSLCDNQYFKSFINYYESGQVIRQIEVIDQLETLETYVPNLQNICFYFPEEGYTLSTSQSVSSLEMYNDAAFLLMLSQSGRQNKRTYVREVQYASAKFPTQVISIVHALPINKSSKPTAYLIIDLDYDLILRPFEKMIVNSNSTMLLFDENNALISSVGLPYSLEKLFPDGTDDQVGSTAFSERRVDGDKLYIYTNHVKSFGWTYVFVQNLSLAYQGMARLQIVIACICFLLLALSIIYSWVVSKYLYKPFREAKIKMGEPNADFFDQVDRIIEENERYTADFQNNVILGRNRQLFHQALRGFHTDIDGAELQQMIPPGHECVICLMKLDPNDEIISDQNIGAFLRQYDMQFIIKLYTAQNEIALVITAPHFDLTQMHKITGDMLSSFLSGEVCIGVSRPFTELSEVTTAYYQAREALDMYLVRGPGSCYCFLDIRNKPVPEYPYRLENAVLRAFSNGDEQAVTQAVEDFERYLLDIDALPQHVRGFYLQLFCSCQRLIIDKPRDAQITIRYSHRELLASDSIQEMSSYIISMLTSMQEATSVSSNENSHALIEKVCAYITAHLSDKITVEDLSARFYINRTTLRAEFFSVTGSTIKAYIDQQKIIRAKQLLSEDHRVQDVAMQTGFLYSQSFSTFFKNATGMTPGEYRMRLRTLPPDTPGERQPQSDESSDE